MSNLVIVAIPDENDRVWKVSSEKIPHLTLLFLGDSDQVANVDQITQFVEHAATMTLNRFYLPVDRRDELGEDKADTLIFKKGRYDYKAIRDFRVQLLKNDNIRTAYDSANQHEGPWLPHLTLGYPASPAKPDETDRDFGFYDVGFNKIAVWVDDYDGPEFLLKDPWDDWDTLETAPMDVAWSAITQAGAEHLVKHYGVKGMRWGVQKADETKKGLGLVNPEGHKLTNDVTKVAAGVIFPPFAPLTIPAQVRLTRAAYRAHQTNKADKKVGLSKEDAKFEKVAQSQDALVAIHNGAAKTINSKIDGINKKYSAESLAHPEKQKQYDAEVKKLMQDAYKTSANQLGNKHGTKHLDLEFDDKGGFKVKVKDGMQTPTEEAKHSAVVADDGTVTFSGKIERDAAGYITNLVFDDFDREPENTLAQQHVEDGAEYLVHAGVMSPDYFLEHYGVKGMQWGVRRERGVPLAVTPMATSRVRAGNKRKTKVQVEGGQNHDAHPDALKVAEATAKLKKSGAVALSNSELREVAQRLQLEGQVKQLTSNAGTKFVKNLLKQQGQQQAQSLVNQQVKKQFSK